MLCKCLSDLNFERDLVRFQRGGKEGGGGKGRGEKRGDRAKRNEEIHGKGGRFRRPVARSSRKRSRREGDSGTVIAGRSEIHPNGGAFSPRKKKNTFLRGAFVAKLKGSFFFSSLSLSLSLFPSLPLASLSREPRRTRRMDSPHPLPFSFDVFAWHTDGAFLSLFAYARRYPAGSATFDFRR